MLHLLAFLVMFFSIFVVKRKDVIFVCIMIKEVYEGLAKSAYLGVIV